MDDWRMQQQQRRPFTQIGPIQTCRIRPSPYPTYQYQQSSTIPVQNDANSSNVYYPPTSIEQRFINRKFSLHPSHQQTMSARIRSMPYPPPSMYTHSPNSVCQYTSQMSYTSTQPMYYSSSYSTKNSIPVKSDELLSHSSTSYHSSMNSNSYIPVQQLTPISHEYLTFTSPPSNPSTPYQGEFNSNAEFGVPYHHGQPSSVNSLTDALCPSENSIDRQLTPGPPSVGTPRVAQHQYSFPQTPSTPSSTTSRFSNEQITDELTAFLQDPVNMYLTDDFTSTLFDDIEVLADTYLGGGRINQADNDFDYDILLNYLCSDDSINTIYKN